MPLSDEGKKVLSAMINNYGPQKGKGVFYATINKGKGKGWEKAGNQYSSKSVEYALKKMKG